MGSRAPSGLQNTGPISSVAPRLAGLELGAVCLVSALLALASFGRGLGYGLTDLDTLMNIASVRINHPGDIPDLLLSKLTGGRAGLDANFYRPTVMAIFAVIRGLFGLMPAPYHAVNIALHAACIVLVVAFARTAALRFGLPRPRSFSIFAGLAFALHPASLDVVPGVARLAHVLEAPLVLAALLATDRFVTRCGHAKSSASREVLSSAALFHLLFFVAITSKEPAIVLLLLAPLYLYFARSGAPTSKRWIEAALLVLPAAVLAAGFLVLRAKVLGEYLGGYHLDSTIWRMVKLVANFAPIDLLVPAFSDWVEGVLPVYGGLSLLDSTTFLVVSITGLAAAIALWVFGLRRAGSESPVAGRWTRAIARIDRASRTPGARLALFALAAIMLFNAIFVVVKVYDRRLIYTSLPFFALLIAGIWDFACFELTARIRTGRWRLSRMLRVLWIAPAATTAAILIWQSPLLHRDLEWVEAGLATQLTTEEIRDRWARLPRRSVIWLANLPGGFDLDPSRRITYTPRSSTNALNSRAVQAWLDDQLPGSELRVRSLGTHRYREPLSTFRHAAEVSDAWVEFNTPLARTDFDIAVAAKAGLRMRPLGEGRIALAPMPKSTPGSEYLLIIDGDDPLFVSLSALRARP